MWFGKKNIKDKTLDYYKYFSILLQEVQVEIDEEFLIRMIMLVNDVMAVLPQKNNSEEQR